MAGAKTLSLGALYWYRLALPLRELGRNGYATVMGFALDARPSGALAVMDQYGEWHDDCDVLILQRLMRKDVPAAIASAVASGQIVINDVDDNFFALPPTNRASRLLDPVASPDENWKIYKEVIKASSGSIVSTPHLADVISGMCPSVVVCRNAVDLQRWETHDPAGLPIGWVGSLAWRARDFSVFGNSISAYLRSSGTHFYHGGAGGPVTELQMASELHVDLSSMRSAPMVSFRDYPTLWRPLGVSLIPLENVSFNRCKSWLKGLESAACGVPFIASRLPEYEQLGFGRLADTPQEWLAHLEALSDDATRRSEGLAARDAASAHDISRQWPQWDTAVRSIACCGKKTGRAIKK